MKTLSQRPAWALGFTAVLEILPRSRAAAAARSAKDPTCQGTLLPVICYCMGTMETQMAFLVALAVVLFITGAVMNKECKTDRQLWWCAPPHPHVSGVVRSRETPPKRVGPESGSNS